MLRTFQKKDQNQLNQWIGGRNRYDLLYKASRDGCSNTAFHQKCDKKGPTVTVFYNTSDCVFGGYTAVSWDSSMGYKNDPQAFLFSLWFKKSRSPKKFPAKDGNNAIHAHASFGPVFGAGHDINSFSGTIPHNGSCFPLNGGLGLGSSYNMMGNNASTVLPSSLSCFDIEVYSVKRSGGGSVKDYPWRNVVDCESDSIKAEIEAYSPIKRVNIERVNILLVGAVGSGKSSYYNTVNSIFRGRVTSQACSGSAEHSLTTHYRKYKVRSPKTGKPLKFRLCDTRGLEEAQGLDAVDVVAMLDGHLPDRYMFNPAEAISSTSSKSIPTPALEEKIHCVAFVVDSCSVDVFPDKILHNVKAIQQKANQRGIPQVVLLSKVDKICSDVAEDPGTLFYSSAVSDLVEQVSELVGLPRAHVLPVKNYEQESRLVEEVDVLALISLRQMLRFADDYLYNYLDEEDVTGRWWMCSLS